MPRHQRLSRKLGTPRNTRLVVPVRQAIDHYQELKRREVDTSIEASGIDAFLYPCIRAGRPCTCDSGAPLLNASGDMSNDQLNKFFNNPDALEEVKKDFSEKEVEEPTRGSSNDLRKRKTFVAESVDFKDTKPPVDDPITPEDESAITDADLLDLGEGFMGEDFLDFGAVTCGVCLGTGFIKGYTLYRGYHLLATVGDQTAMAEFRPNTIAKPYSFALDDEVLEGSVDFQVIIPKGARLLASRLRNNLASVADYTLHEVVNGTELPVDNLELLADGFPHTLRVTTAQEFTHFEANFDTQGVRVRIDFGQQDVGQFSKNLEGSENPEVEVSVPSYVANFGKHSLIRDFKYNRTWYVTSSRPQLNAKGDEVIFIEVTARLLQPHEVYTGIL